MCCLYRLGTLTLLFVFLYGCSSNSLSIKTNEAKESQFKTSTNENSSKATELTEKEYVEESAEAESSSSNDPLSTSQKDNVSLEEKELLKERLRTYIFDEYVASPDYGYAKGINWSENFYDNLTADEIWDVIEEFKKTNNGENGTLFDQALYLSVNAPIKDNWKELFLEEWGHGSRSEENEIDTLIDKGDTVWVYTKSLPYTGEKDNYPLFVLTKRTGAWHG
ncbi:hypothetical protein [Fredinandcohnia onubensis]|uniref:hypothetical protein n=1 Tax=Fredinandcohnia onubensis TaxID=1571209 RepID=UPI000C0BD475|nr:hypothetical protein [Fredinandcohnia onubensis]